MIATRQSIKMSTPDTPPFVITAVSPPFCLQTLVAVVHSWDYITALPFSAAAELTACYIETLTLPWLADLVVIFVNYAVRRSLSRWACPARPPPAPSAWSPRWTSCPRWAGWTCTTSPMSSSSPSSFSARETGPSSRYCTVQYIYTVKKIGGKSYRYNK